MLSYEVWGYRLNGQTVVARHNLTYVNHAIHQADNGRVLGLNNAHNYHHRHFMGKVQAVEFFSFEATLERFQREWAEIVKLNRRKKS